MGGRRDFSNGDRALGTPEPEGRVPVTSLRDRHPSPRPSPLPQVSLFSEDHERLCHLDLDLAPPSLRVTEARAGVGPPGKAKGPP